VGSTYLGAMRSDVVAHGGCLSSPKRACDSSHPEAADQE